MVKEDAFLHIRIKEDLKDEFIKACKYNGHSYSKVIRMLIQDYIAEKGQKGKYV